MRTNTTAVLVGGGTNFRQAPLDSDAEVWSLNTMHRLWPELEQAADLWFDLHKRSVNETRNPGQHEWLQQGDGPPVLIQQEYADYPRGRRFPAAEIRQEFRRGGYHASSVDWIIAYAALKGIDGLHLYGMDFFAAGLPVSARPCMEYWAGVAEQRGTVVRVQTQSVLFSILTRAKIDEEYGYDDYRHLIDLTGD